MEHIIKRYAKCQQIYYQFLEVLFINWTNNVQTGPFKFLPNSPENDQREYVAAKIDKNIVVGKSEESGVKIWKKYEEKNKKNENM